MYKIHIELLALMGVLASSPKPARIIKQINRLSRYKGDKMGMNLALLICHTLYLYFIGEEDQFNVHIDAVKKYSSSYLKEGNERSKIFLKMLILLPLRKYESVKFNRKIRILREKLTEKSIDQVNQAADIEVIPYEDFWNLVLTQHPITQNSRYQSRNSGERARF